MQKRRDDLATTAGRLEYHAPEITDLGSVVELTEAAGPANGGPFDGTGYHVAGHS
jgi:hypothetical protein